MKVVLIENVKGLGNAGDIVEVKDGYGRNFIIKNKKGLPGTKENIEMALAKQAERAKVLVEEKQAAVELAAKLSKTTITIAERSGEYGQLFGSVTSKDIAQALKDQEGIDIDKRKITLAEPIRHIGKMDVKVKTYAGVEGELTVAVV
ncbi:50S ribosomal protein L9, partial [Eubacterium aggregans]|uniref:50S ribosomal protein L9 n=1 Tax=Eubacterium aggregans TaxID=81409 RepID=UPI003F2FDB24